MRKKKTRTNKQSLNGMKHSKENKEVQWLWNEKLKSSFGTFNNNNVKDKDVWEQNTTS